MAKSLKFFALSLGCFAVTAFLLRHENLDLSSWTPVFLICLVIYVPFGFPTVRAFIMTRPRTIFWTGIALAVGAIATIFGISFMSAFYKFPRGITGADPISTALVSVMMAGVALTILPRSLAALKRAENSGLTSPTAQQRSSAFRGDQEAWEAISAVLCNWAPFVRLFGPWIVLLWAVPLAGFHIAAFSSGITSSLIDSPIGKVSPMIALFGERLPYTITLAFAFPIALVSWHRYLLHDGPFGSALRVPLAVAARYLWRLWMVALLLSILNKLVATNVPDLARLLRVSDSVVLAKVLYGALLFVAVYLGSTFALVFPAIARGNRNFLGTDSARMSKPLGNSFRLGFVLSLLPFATIWWAMTMILYRAGIRGPSSSLLAYTLWVAPIAAMFLALASGATYLSRVYAAGSKE